MLPLRCSGPSGRTTADPVSLGSGRIGLQELAGDPRLATNVMRLAERSWLIPALQEVLSAIPQDEIVRRCERANVSWAPVGQPGDLFTDEHLLATGGLVDVFISRFGEPGGKMAGLPALTSVERQVDKARVEPRQLLITAAEPLHRGRGPHRL